MLPRLFPVVSIDTPLGGVAVQFIFTIPKSISNRIVFFLLFFLFPLFWYRPKKEDILPFLHKTLSRFYIYCIQHYSHINTLKEWNAVDAWADAGVRWHIQFFSLFERLIAQSSGYIVMLYLYIRCLYSRPSYLYYSAVIQPLTDWLTGRPLFLFRRNEKAVKSTRKLIDSYKRSDSKKGEEKYKNKKQIVKNKVRCNPSSSGIAHDDHHYTLMPIAIEFLKRG
jgi:hypothetical protein